MPLQKPSIGIAAHIDAGTTLTERLYFTGTSGASRGPRRPGHNGLHEAGTGARYHHRLGRDFVPVEGPPISIDTPGTSTSPSRLSARPRDRRHDRPFLRGCRRGASERNRGTRPIVTRCPSFVNKMDDRADLTSRHPDGEVSRRAVPFQVPIGARIISRV